MCKSRLFLCCILTLSTFGLPAFAQTLDGQTPAKEGVCDVLKDLPTKGLYGLCVAFCEAQDFSDEPATKKSRQKILDNYNNLRLANNEREMPCLSAVIQTPPQPSCPCWSAAEAGAIDGVLSDGSTIAAGWPAPTSSSSACSAQPEMPYIQEANNNATEVSYIQVVDIASTFSSLHQCKYRKIVPGQPIADVLLSIEWGTLTAEEHAACKADLLARQAALNVCQ